MPTYVFKCVPHAHQFEVQLAFTDPAPEVCAVCGEAPVRKVFTPVGVTFKGSGFYKTDSRGSGGSASSPAKSDGDSSSGSSGSATPASTSSSSDSSSSSATPAPSSPAPAPSSSPASGTT